MKNYKLIREKSIQFLCEEKTKEWFCHVQFVEKIAIKLTKKFTGSEQIVSIAAILHDIGRDKEQDGEDHREAGIRIAHEFLSEFEIDAGDLALVLTCVGNHGAEKKPQSIEERIIITADSASKVLYHQAFMLMVKKPTYREKAEWGLKYLEKGFKKIQFPEYQTRLEASYKTQKNLYLEVLKRV